VLTKGKQVLTNVPDGTHLKPLSEIYKVFCCVEKTSEEAVRETV